jgi:hypothetical protein
MEENSVHRMIKNRTKKRGIVAIIQEYGSKSRGEVIFGREEVVLEGKKRGK